MKQLGPLGVFAVAAVAAGVMPLVGSDYAVSFSIQLLIFLVLAYSWNLIGGYTGYTHFGQVAFFGIGAYVGSLLIFHWNVPWYLAALAAALAGAITALPLGGAMLRLKGPFFAIGMFGLGELAVTLGRPQDRSLLSFKLKNLWPSWAEIRQCIPAMLRGTALGSVLGVLPGGGAALSSFAAYALEKKVSRNAAQFGRGAIEGVAAPEAANNAGAQTSFIPLLTLGIPGNAIMALMVGAMMIQGIQPGPQVMIAQPQLFWGVIASMWLGNLMLIVLNLPLIGLWVALLRVPYRLMFPAIVLFCCIGTYTVGNTVFDIWAMLLFGVLGVFFYKVGAEPAPFILGFILGPLMEENFRRAMYLSRGDPRVFIERPISAVLLLMSLVLLVILVLPAVKRKREEVFQE